MALVLSERYNYSWRVTVESPTEGARFEQHACDAQFKRLSQSPIEEIMSDAINAQLKDVEVASELLVGWAGVTDGNEQIPYSEKTKAEVLNMPLVASSLVKAWMESLAGARKKN